MTGTAYDGSLQQAIGWLAASIGGARLAQEAHRARSADAPDVAAHLLRWADLSVANLSSVEWADRKRHWADTDTLLYPEEATA